MWTLPRQRRSFASLENALELPNLIDIQRRSFEWLTDPQKGGLRETIDDISPIEDYTGNLAVVFGELWFDDPPASIDECREKDMIYSRPLNVKVAFQNRDTGEIREQTVFMGDFPWMTDWGTFIINGTERVVVTQLVRSPGAYVMEPKDREKQVFIANLMPARGSWLELEIDKKGRVYVRVDRKRKLPVTVLLRAIGIADGRGDPEALRQLGLHPEHDRRRPREHEVRGGRADRAVQEAAPGRAAVARRRARTCSTAVLRPEALRPHARRPLQAELAARPRRRPRHARPHERRHRRARARAGHRAASCSALPEDEEIKDYAAEAQDAAARADPGPPRRVRALRQPPPADGRRADPGGLPDRPLPDGARRARAPHDRGRRHDHAADDHQHPARWWRR